MATAWRTLSCAIELTHLRATGLQVAKICLGTMTYGTLTESRPWALDKEQSRPFIQKALGIGINFFDTADVYSDGASEEVGGRALRNLPSAME
jgi:aryl-alcohol dehydrogenase-like predicted oxidoreductase